MQRTTEDDLLKLIRILRKDARKSLTVLSKETGIPVSTVYEKLKQQAPMYVQKYTCLLDFHAMGYRTRAWFLLKVRKDSKQRFEEEVKGNEHINTLIRVSGQYDYVLEGVFTGMQEIEKFVDEMEKLHGLKSVLPLFTLEEITREGFFKEPVHHEQI
ncbi:MAG: Lrp/AsnC family transcriptional regulator [Candidatus Woesearchaeota archaeon]